MASLTPWQFLIVGYLITVAIETPILLLALHPSHNLKTRLFAGLWLTACTYPIVILALPSLTGTNYDLIAETFAPIAEILAFRAMSGAWNLRDAVAILTANLASYSFGLLLFG
jgi:hypothetical protein